MYDSITTTTVRVSDVTDISVATCSGKLVTAGMEL